jgi:hypothetical protein
MDISNVDIFTYPNTENTRIVSVTPEIIRNKISG